LIVYNVDLLITLYSVYTD